MKIGILAPDEASAQLAVEEGQLLGVDVAWRIVDKNNSFKQLDDLVKNDGIEGLVVRSPYGYELSEQSIIPIVTMHISRMDLFRAAKFTTPGTMVAFLYPPDDKEKFTYDLDELIHFPNHSIQVLGINQNNLSKNLMDRSFWVDEETFEIFKKCDAVMTSTPLLMQEATKLGKECVVIPFDRFDLSCAIRNLINAINTRNVEKRNTRLVELALNATNDGFIILDKKTVVMANENISAMTGLTHDEIIGKTKEELSLSNKFFNKVFAVERKEIISSEEVLYSVFRRNLSIETGKGTLKDVELISIIDVPKIQKTESSIRESMEEKGFNANWKFEDVIAESKSMKSLIRTARQFANASSNVLILGESGSGKDVIAQSIHNASPYARGPFVALNCASLPDTLLESELFGYEDGAFSGARKGGKPGIIELAHGGTLFLDEIGEMPISLQAKLLRVIQDKRITRVGGTRNIPVHCRMLFATNQDLYEMVREKKFRLDLLYRINVLELKIPPLRERREDVAPLVKVFLEKYQGASRKKIEKGAVEYIEELSVNYNWPGNVRELENCMERLLVMQRNGATGEELDEMFKESVGQSISDGDQNLVNAEIKSNGIEVAFGSLKSMEDQIIKAVYEKNGKNMRKAAAELEIGYNTIRRWINN